MTSLTSFSFAHCRGQVHCYRVSVQSLSKPFKQTQPEPTLCTCSTFYFTKWNAISFSICSINVWLCVCGCVCVSVCVAYYASQVCFCFQARAYRFQRSERESSSSEHLYRPRLHFQHWPPSPPHLFRMHVSPLCAPLDLNPYRHRPTASQAEVELRPIPAEQLVLWRFLRAPLNFYRITHRHIPIHKVHIKGER